MEPLTIEDLLGLEQYARERKQWREKAIRQKQLRRVAIGPNVSIYFEDRITIQYQIQEMLRIEKMFEPEEVECELEAYNPLIPNGHNWKATMMIEFPDEDERRVALAKMIGIENRTAIMVEGFDPVYAVANEDLDRTTGDKTSAVHFLRFELTEEMAKAVKAGSNIGVAIKHDNYTHSVPIVEPETSESLAADLG
ncbi:MAG TPA: DUF3501 family protein [Nitrospinota bacterium]|jgi:hypothetical protein|nr:DUF3501 family protein [Nitrospinota bacterium]|tara:strand:- start:113631 stop:114215 length:585 start_codon:yes stop_codon:yes gene_type:complete